MNEIELLIDFHRDAERQGPGSPSDTLKALSLASIDQNKPLQIADIGCGTGAQTITLAQNLTGEITAVDLFPEFLSRLEERARAPELKAKIKTRKASMDDLPFRSEQFDLIWSEGAIYIMGFEEGIRKWKEYLKPGGTMAVSEITWLTHTRPEEIEAHWNQEYPQVDTASNKIKILEQNGFVPTGYFTLPEESWLEGYYNPMEERFEAFLQKHQNSEIAQALVDAEKEENRLYTTYKNFYSYGFYIAQKQ